MDWFISQMNNLLDIMLLQDKNSRRICICMYICCFNISVFCVPVLGFLSVSGLNYMHSPFFSQCIMLSYNYIASFPLIFLHQYISYRDFIPRIIEFQTGLLYLLNVKWNSTLPKSLLVILNSFFFFPHSKQRHENDIATSMDSYPVKIARQLYFPFSCLLLNH